MTVEYHPAVERELKEIRDFYESRVPGLGKEFIDEFERQVLRIASTPSRWMVLAGDLRRAMMPRFPYLICFRQPDPKPCAYHDCKTSAPTSGLWTRAKITDKGINMNEEQKKALPLKAAYEFGGLNGLEREVREIRDMVIEWDLSYTSSLRRGYIVALFESKGVFDKFKRELWAFGNIPAGETKRSWYLRIKARYEAFLSGRGLEPESGNDCLRYFYINHSINHLQ